MPKFIKLTKLKSSEEFYLNVLHVIHFWSNLEGSSVETADEILVVTQTPEQILALIEKP